MKFIAFDLETTGIDSTSMIVEIGAVLFNNSVVLDTYSELVNPTIPIPYGASAVNGITDEMVGGKPFIEELLPSFSEFCKDYPLIAHNASFDYKFLKRDFEQHRIASPRGIVLDTLVLSRKIFTGMPSYKLSELAKSFGFIGGGFHRAEEDSMYCGRLFNHMCQALEQRGESVSLDLLVQLTNKSALYFPQLKDDAEQLDLL